MKWETQDCPSFNGLANMGCVHEAYQTAAPRRAGRRRAGSSRGEAESMLAGNSSGIRSTRSCGACTILTTTKSKRTQAKGEGATAHQLHRQAANGCQEGCATAGGCKTIYVDDHNLSSHLASRVAIQNAAQHSRSPGSDERVWPRQRMHQLTSKTWPLPVEITGRSSPATLRWLLLNFIKEKYSPGRNALLAGLRAHKRAHDSSSCPVTALAEMQERPRRTAIV